MSDERHKCIVCCELNEIPMFMADSGRYEWPIGERMLKRKKVEEEKAPVHKCVCCGAYAESYQIKLVPPRQAAIAVSETETKSVVVPAALVYYCECGNIQFLPMAE